MLHLQTGAQIEQFNKAMISWSGIIPLLTITALDNYLFSLWSSNYDTYCVVFQHSSVLISQAIPDKYQFLDTFWQLLADLRIYSTGIWMVFYRHS